MRNTSTQRLRSLGSRVFGLVTIGAIALASNAASAQEALRPPKADGELSSSKYVMMVIILLLTGATVFVVTLKSKRGHQD